jgi:frataxin-like iron-binding protein CyaY
MVDRKATVTLLLAGDLNPVKSALLSELKGLKTDVPDEDILSLWVTVTQVVLVPEESEEMETQEPEEKRAGVGEDHIIVFTGSKEVDLMDLTEISALLTQEEVPAGTYKQIRLWIENPEMYLVGMDPEVDPPITDIKLTASARLFITQTFELYGGSSSVVSMDLTGVKIVDLGNDKYTWTPQLDVLLEVEQAATEAEGIITDIQTDVDVFTLVLDDASSFQVDYSGALDNIWLPTDTTDPNGTELDLEGALWTGQRVQVVGTLSADGTTITAQMITIFPEVTL